jgi:hypothetical protein
MSSPDPGARAGVDLSRRTLAPLLDAAFGFFVWAAHLVGIYVAAALACGLDAVRTGALGPAGLRSVLVAVTALAAAVVALHGVRSWRRRREAPEPRFRVAVTVGCDAIAALGIVWQLLAIGLVPVCW